MRVQMPHPFSLSRRSTEPSYAHRASSSGRPSSLKVSLSEGLLGLYMPLNDSEGSRIAILNLREEKRLAERNILEESFQQASTIHVDNLPSGRNQDEMTAHELKAHDFEGAASNRGSPTVSNR